MSINNNTLVEVYAHYREIAEGALERAVHLNSKGVVLEFETLLEMTKTPDIGVEIVKIMNDVCEKYYQNFGLASEIRLTPNDLREFERPAKQRSSAYLEPMFELFERGLLAGGDLLSIESTGGKEVSDEALMMCDVKGVMFALSVLGVRDMQFLWHKIVSLTNQHGKIAAGDSACGFANTAMVLAEKKYIPKVFAALVRVISVGTFHCRDEEGAVGPDKDCGYEGPFPEGYFRYSNFDGRQNRSLRPFEPGRGISLPLVRICGAMNRFKISNYFPEWRQLPTSNNWNTMPD